MDGVEQSRQFSETWDIVVLRFWKGYVMYDTLGLNLRQRRERGIPHVWLSNHVHNEGAHNTYNSHYNGTVPG